LTCAVSANLGRHLLRKYATTHLVHMSAQSRYTSHPMTILALEDRDRRCAQVNWWDLGVPPPLWLPSSWSGLPTSSNGVSMSGKQLVGVGGEGEGWQDMLGERSDISLNVTMLYTFGSHSQSAL